MQLEHQGEHHIAGDGVVPGLCSALCIDGILLVGQLIQEVISLQLGGDSSFATGRFLISDLEFHLHGDDSFVELATFIIYHRGLDGVSLA